MNKKQRTLIFYHVPEDKDTPDEPNVFTIPTPQDRVTLAHILQYFPLKGTYAFRFKLLYDSFVVWLDLSTMEQPVPTFKNEIHLKANRLSWLDQKPVIPAINKTNLPASSSHRKQDVDIFSHEEPPKEVKVHKKSADFGEFQGINLLEAQKNAQKGHSFSATQQQPLKVDFFADEAPVQINKDPRPQQNAFHSGDLI